MRAACIGLACIGTLGLAALVGLHATPSAADYEARFQIVPQDNGGSVWLLNTMTGELRLCVAEMSGTPLCGSTAQMQGAG
jgi:hypothetical protein